LDFAQGGAYLAVAIGLALTPMPIPLKLGVVLVLLLFLFRRLRARQNLPSALELLPDGTLSWHTADSSARNYKVDMTTTVLPWLTVLRLEGQDGKRSLVLLRDSMAADEYRQLRVWLRWRVSAGS
jgi:toxin CptA